MRSLCAATAAFLALPTLVSAQVIGTVPTVTAGGRGASALPAVPVAPPALPLPVGTKLLGIGDSLVGFNHGVINIGGLVAANSSMDGLLVTAWSDLQNFNFDVWADPGGPWNGSGQTKVNGADQGIPGDHLDWLQLAYGNGAYNRTTYAVSRAPGIAFVLIGTNTISSGDNNGQAGSGSTMGGAYVPPSLAYLSAKIDNIVNQFTRRGCWVILSTLYPRGDWPAKDVRRQRLLELNGWIREQGTRPGVKIMDAYDLLVDPADPEGVRANLYREGTSGVHPNQAGTWAIYNQRLKPILKTMLSSGSTFDQDPAVTNIYPASTALFNGGGTGTKGNSSVAGAIATGQTVTVGRGTSTVAATIEDAGSYKRQVLTITPVLDGYAQAYHEVDMALANITTGLPAAGSWVKAWIHIETPDALGPSMVKYNLSISNGGTQLLNPSGDTLASPQFAVPTPGRGDYWIEVPPFQMPGGATTIQSTVQILFPKAMTSSFTVKIDRPIFRAVADPRTAWNLP